MRSLLSAPGYELSFSLLNPQPEVLNAEWDIAQAVKGTGTILVLFPTLYTNHDC